MHEHVEVGQQGEERQISANVEKLEAEFEPQENLKEFLVLINQEYLLPCLEMEMNTLDFLKEIIQDDLNSVGIIRFGQRHNSKQNR